jgi:Na+-transporting NADH:ubiquinone oxidoreductase subunit C
MGLWGPIWGYLALDDDRNTIFGVYFNHESETAGLGAEIKDNEKWQLQFRGKKIFKEGTDEIGLAVVKKNEDLTTQCDGITGATLTMDSVTQMFRDCLAQYMSWLKNE